MTVARTKHLTSASYWNREWSRLSPARDYRSLTWVERNYVYRAFDGICRSVLPTDPGLSFLELGSGPARWMIYFHARFGYRVFGCDYSDVSCQLARQNLAAAGVPGQVWEADFFAFEGQFDVVFSGGVVEHFDNPRDVLARFAGLVKPGGYLVTDVPNLGGINGVYQRALKPETFDTHRLVRLADLRAHHAALGLQELAATPYGSFSLTRLPGTIRGHAVPSRLWHPLWVAALRTVNRTCLGLGRFGVHLDHELYSPHLLVISRKPSGGSA